MSDKENKAVDTEAKSKKPEKKKKEKKTGKIKAAWLGFNSERKKIVWPTWAQVMKNTLVVLVLVGCCAVVLAVLDMAFHEGITSLPKLINNLIK